jgi:membrane protease YdiL (CAAX protease family)
MKMPQFENGAFGWLDRQIAPFFLGLSLIIVPYFVPIFSLPVKALYKLAVSSNLLDPSSFLPFWQVMTSLLTTFLLAALVHWWEQGTWSSIGFSRPTLADLFIGVSFFLIACLITLPSSKIRLSLPSSAPGSVGIELWFLAIVASGVLFEEVATRAYIIEHVAKLTGSTALAGIASLCLAFGAHLLGRNLAAALSRGPVLLLLTALYLWRRNILPGVIAHFLLDASVLLMVSSAGWLVEWTLSPTPLCLALASVFLLYLITWYLRLDRRTLVSSASPRSSQ